MMLDRQLLSVSILKWSVLILGLIGLTSYGQYSHVPTRAILDVAFFASAALVVSYPKSYSILFLWLGFCITLILSVGYYLLSDLAHWLDFFLIYKYYFYVLALAFFVGRNAVSEVELLLFFKTLILFFAIKYTLWLFLGAFERPGLYGENNFELIFLAMVYLVVLARGAEFSKYYILLLFYIFLLSQSRSGIVVLLFVYAIASFKKLDLKLVVSIISLLIVSLMAGYIFNERLGDSGIEGIDRLRFLSYFLIEISGFDFYQLLFGAAPITPLSDLTCTALGSYENLMAYADSRYCYSVVFHAFNLRVLFDHGFLGFVFSFLIVERYLYYSAVNFRFRLAVLGVIFLTGMSVSSLNNIFVVMGVLLFLVSKPAGDHPILTVDQRTNP